MGFRSLEQLPGSRELFTGLAWATLAALVPSLAAGPARAWHASVAVSFLASLLLVAERTLTLGLGAVESDRLVGRETLAGMLGPPAVRWVFFSLAALLAGVIGLGGCLGGATTDFCLPFLLVVPYVAACFLLMQRLRRPAGALTEALTDAVFYLAGLLALAWMAAH
jgi:4-hydroxy-3-methylbut-2-enyl diphosphate reductase